MERGVVCHVGVGWEAGGRWSGERLVGGPGGSERRVVLHRGQPDG